MGNEEELDIQVFKGGKWVPAGKRMLKGCVRWRDIWWFYANIIDYTRVLMCLIAGYTLTTEYHWTSAFLIIGSTLLDWVDGPVARAYNQCSIMGSGWDWCADILCQLCQVMWWARYDISVLPILFLCTSIEITLCIFDFAITATGKYPEFPHDSKLTGFMYIVPLSGCNSSWNSPLYTSMWLAYPVYCVGRTLELALLTPPSLDSPLGALLLANRWIGLPLAFMYIWCEAAVCVHMVSNWTELPRAKVSYDDTAESAVGGFISYGLLDGPDALFEQEGAEHAKALQAAFKHISDPKTELGAAHSTAVALGDIFWINVWQLTGGKPPIDIPGIEGGAAGLEKFARWAVDKFYNNGKSREELGGAYAELNGYGFITNPRGGKTQDWHLDYSLGYSSIFVPMTPPRNESMTQYVVVPTQTPQALVDKAIKNPDVVDLTVFTGPEGLGYSVRQVVGRVNEVIRMDFGTIHRGITNTGPEDRTMFWLSVKRLDDTTEIKEEAKLISIPQYLSGQGTENGNGKETTANGKEGMRKRVN